MRVIQVSTRGQYFIRPITRLRPLNVAGQSEYMPKREELRIRKRSSGGENGYAIVCLFVCLFGFFVSAWRYPRVEIGTKNKGFCCEHVENV